MNSPQRSDVLNIRYISPKVREGIKKYCAKEGISLGKWCEIAQKALTSKEKYRFINGVYMGKE